MTLKRTCKKCRALYEIVDVYSTYSRKATEEFICRLRHKIKRQFYMGIEIYPIPLEECQKPLTHKKYLAARKSY